jgi:hypothetical protein
VALEEELDEVRPVITPTASPPSAPARMPIKASIATLSKMDFLPLMMGLPGTLAGQDCVRLQARSSGGCGAKLTYFTIGAICGKQDFSCKITVSQ